MPRQDRNLMLSDRCPGKDCLGAMPRQDRNLMLSERCPGKTSRSLLLGSNVSIIMPSKFLILLPNPVRNVMLSDRCLG